MRYVVAIAVSVVLTVLMFVFEHWMMGCVKVWEAQRAELLAITQTAVRAAYFIQVFWYLPVALFFAIPLAIAAIWPRKGRRDQSSKL
jgi:preprotein translocase subunit SecG